MVFSGVFSLHLGVHHECFSEMCHTGLTSFVMMLVYHLAIV